MADKTGVSVEAAELIALHALAFLAGDAQRLSGFLNHTGVGPDDLKSAATTRPFQAAVLAYLLQNESLLMVCSTETGDAPGHIEPAHRVLAGEA
ncbi:MAG: DUF3572 domain-containing protein [Hyphomicrobiaceae bacterium]